MPLKQSQWEQLLIEQGLKEPFCWQRFGSGRNNQTFLLQCDDDSRYVAKHYFRHPSDQRNRLQAEWNFLKAVWPTAPLSVPQPHWVFSAEDLAIYQFIDGRAVGPQDVGPDLVGQAAQFVACINQMTHLDFQPASEACFSNCQHLSTIQRRVDRVKLLPQDSIQRFYEHTLEPCWVKVQEEFGPASERQLSGQEKILSPSDFGFHNTILRSDGQLSFIDFEYAGLDDPAKLLCDYFCQPQLPVPLTYWSRFSEWCDQRAQSRARQLLPLYQVKWACIVLNPLMPVDSHRRQFAAQQERAITDQEVEQIVARATDCLPPRYR